MLLKFIDLLYPTFPENSYFTISYPKSPTIKSLISEHIELKDKALITSFVKKWVSEKRTVYFGICARKAGLNVYKRGERDDLIGIPGLWLDIDVLNPGAHNQQVLPDQAQAIALIEEFGLDPTLIVDSGYGYHAWWLFDKPEWFEPGSYQRYQKLVDKFQEKFLSFAKNKGFVLDKTSDLPRVLRLPETYNYKKYEPKEVKLLIDDGPRYRITDLEARFLIQETKVAEEVKKESKNVEILRSRLEKHKKIETKPLIKKILKGDIFAEEGERDTKLNQIVSIIAFTGQDLDLDPDDIVEIIEPSLEAMAKATTTLGNPPPDIKECYKKAVRALAKAKEAYEQQKAQELEIRSALAKAVRTENSKTSLYSKEELEFFATQQGCTVKEFEQRWIVQFGNAYFVYFEGSYRGPFVKDVLPVILRDYLQPVEYIQLNKIDQNGQARPKTPTELVTQYGVGAEKAVACLDFKNSYLDKERTYFEAVCPIDGSIKSEYNEQVDTWLKLLGGDNREKFLDWLATVTLLDRPSCALYLSGARSTGKSMLTRGVASLWRTTTPTELSRILDSFNGDLTQCPLVVADEHIPQNVGSRRNTAELRNLIASTSRTLSRKYMPNIELKGAVRLMICGNNDRLLSMGDEDLGQEDLQAVADRFLLIRVNDKAAEYLKSIGGISGTKDWVEGKKIAKHLLWLKENRVIIPGSRFWVEGQTTQVHKSLATQGTIANLVMEWLAKYFTTTSAVASSVNGIFVGNGYVCINTMAVKDNWALFHGDNSRAPTAARIGRTLSNISKGEIHLKDKKGVLNRHHILDAEILLNWMNENQAGNVGEVAAKIIKPSDVSKALEARDPSLSTNSIYMNEISDENKVQGIFN